MENKLKNINESNYAGQQMNRSYHSDLATARINDYEVDNNVKQRDQYFKLIEDSGYSKNQSEKLREYYISEISQMENIYDEDMSAEDKIIIRQERREDPTIDDSYRNDLSINLMYQEDLQNKFDRILSNVDENSKEYQDIQKVEQLISSELDKKDVYEYEYIFEDISLDNSNMDNDIKVQLKESTDEKYIEVSYNDIFIKNNVSLDKYKLEEQSFIGNQLDNVKDKHQDNERFNIQGINSGGEKGKAISFSEYNQTALNYEKRNHYSQYVINDNHTGKNTFVDTDQLNKQFNNQPYEKVTDAMLDIVKERNDSISKGFISEYKKAQREKHYAKYSDLEME